MYWPVFQVGGMGNRFTDAFDFVYGEDVYTPTFASALSAIRKSILSLDFLLSRLPPELPCLPLR